jgi:hypothetical protein
MWETGVYLSYLTTLVTIILLAKSIYDIRKALIKRPGSVFNTSNVLYHLICFLFVFLVGTLMIVDFLGLAAPGIETNEEAAVWFFRAQVAFELSYFVSSIFLIKIFNEIVNQCVNTTVQSVDSENDSDGADDLSCE